MLLAGVARDQVEQHVHAERVGVLEQGGQVIVGAVARCDLRVVAHIISGIFER